MVLLSGLDDTTLGVVESHIGIHAENCIRLGAVPAQEPYWERGKIAMHRSLWEGEMRKRHTQPTCEAW